MAERTPDVPGYEGSGLKRDTNWWGAFVVGLAGTILVTGIAPVIVTELGASAIPETILITISGYLLCLLLAELAAMMPERTGGSPSYAYPAYKDRWPRAAKHINGLTAWMYWFGWFPVAPLNMILASGYLAGKLGLSGAGFSPVGTFISYWTVVIAVVGIVLVFIPAYLGIRLGTVFATVLGVLSMIPLTLLAVLPFFNLSVAHFGELRGFRHLDGSGFFSNAFGHSWWVGYVAFAFLLSWNVIAMEAAACYIGECRDPDRDAKIAMNLEGLYGLFIYTVIPISFIVVLGASKLSNPAFADPKTIFVTFGSHVFSSGGAAVDWLITVMLIIALALSALNAIMGCGRSLYQMAVDGQFPRIFTRVNVHGVPSFAMLFNVACSLVVVFFGGAVQIYTFSNIGYLGSFIPVLIGYYLLRQSHPDWRRPVRLPEFMKYVALGMAVVYFFIWSYGGYMYSVIGHTTLYYWIGWGTALSYLGFYWYRRYVEDPRHEREAEAAGAELAAGE